MSFSPEIVVVGSLNMDLIFRTPRIPAAGETLLGGEFDTAFGGKGANQAVAAARLGTKVAMVGKVGRDEFGPALVSGLRQDNIDTSQISTARESATGVALILLEASGENRIIVASGANLDLSTAEIEAAADLIQQAQLLLLQLEVSVTSVTRAAQLAHEAGVRVILNPAPAQPNLPAELLQKVDILIPNEGEAALLAGLPPESASERKMQEKAARLLLDSGVQTVVTTLGSRGALVTQESGLEHIPPYPTQVVDTTAAGDSFVGGLAAALVAGKSLEEAVRWGNAAGSLACSQLGAQPSLPTRAALMKKLQQSTN